MLIEERGIVLHRIPYGESSLIAQLFCREKGKLSVYIPGARRPKAVISSAYFAPLTVLDMHIYYKPIDRLQKVRTAKATFPLLSLRTSPPKGMYGQLIAEVMLRTLPQGYVNPVLFDDLVRQLRFFEDYGGPADLYAVKWLIHYFQHLGIDPAASELAEHPLIRALADISWEDVHQVNGRRETSHQALHALCRFYEASQHTPLSLQTLRLLTAS